MLKFFAESEALGEPNFEDVAAMGMIQFWSREK
jgi:hypothetical protein